MAEVNRAPARARALLRAVAPDPRGGGSPRASLLVAGVFAAIGAARFATDVLTDLRPGWSQALDGTPLRYLVRSPSDGTFLGDVNVQWFKLLAIPCCVAGLYLLKRLLSRDLRDTQRLWQSSLYRNAFVALFAAMCLVMELEKSFHFLGLRMAGQLAGERAWLNHLLHAASAAVGWWLMRWLAIAGPRPRPVPASGANG